MTYLASNLRAVWLDRDMWASWNRWRWGRLLGVIAVVLAGGDLLPAADWAAFRGPYGNGLCDETAAPVDWNASTNIKWKQPFPQPCNGSPIVSAGKVFVTCAQDKEGKQRSLYCFDRRDGRQLWVQTVAFDKVLPTHKTNPYCGSTPVADGERVIVWHGSAGLFCYDFSGRELWSRNFGEFRHMWGYATSPILLDGKVIMHCSPGAKVFTTALDAKDGKTIWETPEAQEGTGEKREDGSPMGSWVTPVIARVGGQTMLLTCSSLRLMALNPDDGSVLWSCEGLRHSRGDLCYSSPILAGDLCFITGGYNGASLGVALGGRGDVTASHRRWRHEKNPQSIGTGIFLNGYVYRPNAQPGTIECLDPATGKVLWTDRATGAPFWSSIVLVGPLAYVIDQNGTTFVFRPNPERCDVVAKNELGEPTNATLAVSDGEIFLRTDRHLYCIAK